MKLLFDQNLSRKLVDRLQEVFPNCTRVIAARLNETEDSDIWEYAKSHGFAIVSKDDDFHQRSFLYGHPPKVIIIALGNCTTDLVEQTLRQHLKEIGELEMNDSSVLVVPY